MKHLLSKDLGLIFLLTTIYIIIISFPHLIYNKSFLELGFLILLFLFAGYSLISLLRPEENYHNILHKPVLILEFSVLMILAVSIILKFSSLGLHLMILVSVMSIITMVFTISAYVRRIGYYNSNGKNIISTSLDENSIQHEESFIPLEKSIKPDETSIKKPIIKYNLYIDLILGYHEYQQYPFLSQLF